MKTTWFTGNLYQYNVDEPQRYLSADDGQSVHSVQDIYSQASKAKNEKPYWHWVIVVTVVLSLIFPKLSGLILFVGFGNAFYDLFRTKGITIKYNGGKNLEEYHAYCKGIYKLKNSQSTWITVVLANEYFNTGRVVVKIKQKTPKTIKSNIAFPCLDSEGISIFFAPDVLILETATKIYISEYNSINIEQGNVEIKETEFGYPRDSTLIRNEHAYLTTKGQPDKRYKSNPIYPVFNYSYFSLSTRLLDFRIITSRAGAYKEIMFTPFFTIKSNQNQYATDVNTIKLTLDPGITGETHSGSKLYADKTIVSKAGLESSQYKENTLSELHEVKMPGGAPDNDTVNRIPPKSRESIPLSVLKAPEAKPLQRAETKDIDSDKSKHKLDIKVTPEGVWIPGQAVVTIKGIRITGGMVYVYDGLFAPHPSAICIKQSVSKEGDYSKNLTGYYPSYEGLSFLEKGAYLKWLADGRADPLTGIGYVFLYYYGLERRILVDKQKGEVDTDEYTAILAEIKRLLNIYSDNKSFRGYATRLLNYVTDESEIETASPEALENIKLKYLPIKAGTIKPRINKSDLSAALIFAAENYQAIVGDLAYIWASTIDTVIQPEISSNSALYHKSFLVIFNRKYPNGFTPKIKYVGKQLNYAAAAAGLGSFSRVAGQVKQVMSAESNLMEIREIINDLNLLLEPYWRFKRRDKSAPVIVPYLQISVELWPDELVKNVKLFCQTVGVKALVFKELMNALDIKQASRQLQTKLFTRLAEMGVYAEPNVMAGAPAILPDDIIVLFSHAPGMDINESSQSFQIACIYVDLACAVSQADGAFTSHEAEHIREVIRTWPDLTEFQQASVNAKVTLFIERPVSFTRIKSRLSEIPHSHREDVALQLIRVSGVSGYQRKEITLLDKVVKALGIDATLAELLAKLGANSEKYKSKSPGNESFIANETVTDSTDLKGNIGFTLNYDRIKELQFETNEISKTLNEVFAGSDYDDEPVAREAKSLITSSDNIRFNLLPELTPRQSKFLDLLSAKDQWSKEELHPIAKSLNLMLDGTMDVINEHSWTVFDDALHEGDEFIDINKELMEKIVQSRVINS